MILSLLVFLGGITAFHTAALSGEMTEGLSYITIMEQKDASAVGQEIYNTSSQKRLEDMILQLDEDPDMVWRVFQEVDAVIMGDSRVMGFPLYDLMYESRIIADGGATIHDIPMGYETLQIIEPGLLVLAYGINDMNTTDRWPDVSSYIKELNQIMEELTELLPDTYIYVQSILPVDETGIETSPSWAAVPDWNAAIRANCEEKGWRYLDITYILTDFGDLYDTDGIHFQPPVYQYWGEAILSQYLQDSGWA